VTCAPVVVVAPQPVRALRRGILVVMGLVVLATVKPWGSAKAPVDREPQQPALAAVSPPSVAPHPVESPISSICHESQSWRVATEGSFVGGRIREWGFVEPVAARGPADPSIPFVPFSFTLLRTLGYCAPADEQGPLDVDVLVFRIEASGASSVVAVQRDSRTPAWSVAGLFSIAPSARAVKSPPSSGPAAGWPTGRYVFALRSARLGNVWFGADVRTAPGPF
jgi:hypothetical protein